MPCQATIVEPKSTQLQELFMILPCKSIFTSLNVCQWFSFFKSVLRTTQWQMARYQLSTQTKAANSKLPN